MAANDYSFHIVKNPGFITATSIGLGAAPTLDAPGGLTSDDDSDGAYLRHTTGGLPGSGMGAGLISTFDIVRRAWLPSFEFEVKTGSSELDHRIWIGLFSKLPDEIQTPDPASLEYFAGIRYDTSLVSQDKRWWAVTCGPSGVFAQPIGLPVQVVGPDTKYTVRITVIPPANRFTFDVNGDTVTNGLGLPPDLQLLGIGVRIALVGGTTPRFMRWKRVGWTHI